MNDSIEITIRISKQDAVDCVKFIPPEWAGMPEDISPIRRLAVALKQALEEGAFKE